MTCGYSMQYQNWLIHFVPGMEAILCPQAFEEVLPCDQRGMGDGFYGLPLKVHPVAALANHRSSGIPKNKKI